MANKLTDPSNWIKLGDDEQSLWGKTLKIRIVSKKSGKKADLNVQFTAKTEIVESNANNNNC